MQGRAIREVTISLYRRWLAEEIVPASSLSPEQWMREWIQLGEETLHNSPPGPTATELLEDDRNRLEDP